MVTSSSLRSLLSEVLELHPSVPGVSVAVLDGADSPDSVVSAATGFADKAAGEELSDESWLEHASLSKTVATAFALGYFAERSVPPTTPVNELLARCGAPFRLESGPDVADKGWSDQVQLQHLMDHTGLGMHYVNGVPLAHPMPPVLDLITDSPLATKYGYTDVPLRVNKAPGTSMSYSGGGYLLLQYLMELECGCPVAESAADFLRRCGMGDPGTGALSWTFDGKAEPTSSAVFAKGHRDNGDVVDDGRLVFPAYAAGGVGTPRALARFLWHLCRAYHDQAGSGGITHATATFMLDNTRDLGAMAFMQSEIGVGVFVARAGPNRVMLHQAANDGFRGVYMVCFDGPAAAEGPVGFVILANGDDDAVALNCAVARRLLGEVLCGGRGLAPEWVDWTRVEAGPFDSSGVDQANKVNRGLVELILNAFVRDEGPPAKRARGITAEN